MAKKGGAVQLQIEIDTEEDWDKLVERDGLILVDVYSDWCGPCTGMSGNLRKLKLEIGGDVLTLATAKADNIQCLERFRNKSEPTWMFISNSKMIRLMFGANAPRLINIITEEIGRQKKAIADNIPREGIRFDELTEEEQERVDEETRIAEEAARIEKEAKERAINERREEVVNNLLEYMKEYNFVMLWPHVNNDGMAQVFDAIKETELTVAGKPAKVMLTEDNIYEMMYYSSWQLSDDAIEELKKDEVTVLLFQAPMIDFEGDVIDIMVNKVYGAMGSPPGDEDTVAQKISTIIEKECAPEELEMEEEGERTPQINQVSIPGLYVPQNEKAKVIAMRILFPLVTQKFDLPEPEPIPPHLVVAFDAFKKNEVLQLALEYPTETMRIGFFTGADADSAKLIAKTSEQYDKILAPPYDAKLIVQVSKKSSEPLLSYSLLGPTYISPNTVVGEKECATFFPEGYDEPEPEVIEEEVKKKPKKRSRGSKTSVTSSSSKTSQESEGQGGATEEGLEDVMEEGGEDEDGLDELAALTDDALDFDVLQGYEEPIAEPPPEAPTADTAAAEPPEEDKATSPMENVTE